MRILQRYLFPEMFGRIRNFTRLSVGMGVKWQKNIFSMNLSFENLKYQFQNHFDGTVSFIQVIGVSVSATLLLITCVTSGRGSDHSVTWCLLHHKSFQICPTSLLSTLNIPHLSSLLTTTIPLILETAPGTRPRRLKPGCDVCCTHFYKTTGRPRQTTPKVLTY